MGTGEIVYNSVIAAATCAAAVAAWRAARAASSQVELQRPRPVVIVEGNWNVENALNVEPRGFLLRNVGSSPAFDVEVSGIEGPFLQQVQYRERLTTDRIFVLTEGKGPLEAAHHRHVPGDVLDHQAALKFVQNASQTFPPQGDHKMEFFVGYSALDGRRFRTECLICFNLGFPNSRAEVVPASSWLGKETH
jgi:hypothetical protein